MEPPSSEGMGGQGLPQVLVELQKIMHGGFHRYYRHQEQLPQEGWMQTEEEPNAELKRG